MVGVGRILSLANTYARSNRGRSVLSEYPLAFSRWKNMRSREVTSVASVHRVYIRWQLPSTSPVSMPGGWAECGGM